MSNVTPPLTAAQIAARLSAISAQDAADINVRSSNINQPPIACVASSESIPVMLCSIGVRRQRNPFAY